MSRHHHTVLRPAARWRRLRLAVMSASGWRCALCPRSAREVDHIVPLDRGGDPWALDNLQAICRGCHVRKTRAENRSSREVPGQAAWRALLREMARAK